MNFLKKNKLAVALAVVLLIIVIYFYTRKKNREEQEALLFKAISDRSTATGSTSDLKENRAFDPNYYKTKKAPTLNLGYTDAVNKIWDSKGTVKDDEETVLSIYSKMTSKLHASYLARVFQDVKKRDLYQFLNSFMDEKYMERLNSMINKMAD